VRACYGGVDPDSTGEQLGRATSVMSNRQTMKPTDEKESKKPHQDHLVGFFL
jgi:hypothetical protein